MKVKIDKSVFIEAKDDNSQLELDFLLNIILYKNRYELYVDDRDVLSSGGYKSLTRTTQDIISNSIVYSITSSSYNHDCEVKVAGEIEQKKHVFSPSEAILFLMQPFSIILENGLNDSYFMNAIFRLFDSTGTLLNYLNEGWIRFENAGGCANVKNFLRSRIGYYGEKEKFLRCFVLLDGDRRFPADLEPEKKYRKLKEQLDSWKVGYHVLEKRCMENYLPDDAIDSFKSRDNTEWLNAYHSLTPQQKDFLSIGGGFRIDLDKEMRKKVDERESKLHRKDLKLRRKSYVKGLLPPGEMAFFASVSDGNFLHLESGLDIGGFKSRFPKAFTNNVYVYKANMLNRISHQTDPHELENLAASILSLL